MSPTWTDIERWGGCFDPPPAPVPPQKSTDLVEYLDRVLFRALVELTHEYGDPAVAEDIVLGILKSALEDHRRGRRGRIKCV